MRLFLFLVLLCGFTTANAVELQTAAFKQVMKSVPTPNIKARPPFRGVAAIAVDGKMVWQFTQGDGTVPAKGLHQQYVIGSQTKLMTAALVLRAVQQGKLRLDDSVQQLLPNEAGLTPHILLKHLLEHSSGISSDGKMPMYAPGHTFAYSNRGYDLLGNILSQVYQQSYADLAKQMFAACDMRQSFAHSLKQLTSQAPELVQGLAEQKGQLSEVNLDVDEQMVPSGRVVSTAADLLQWQHCLHQGQWQGSTTRWLSTDLHQQMVTPRLARTHRYGPVFYGYGVQVLQQDNLLEWSHSGYVDGYISTTLYYPAYRIGMVILEAQSLQPDDMQRVFWYHDQLRTALRQQLQQSVKETAL